MTSPLTRPELTEAQRCYLRVADELGPIHGRFLSSPSRACLAKLQARGFLHYLTGYFAITDAGRAALKGGRDD
jgi:hypothetical protein